MLLLWCSMFMLTSCIADMNQHVNALSVTPSILSFHSPLLTIQSKYKIRSSSLLEQIQVRLNSKHKHCIATHILGNSKYIYSFFLCRWIKNTAAFTKLNNHSYLKHNSYLTSKLNAMFNMAFLCYILPITGIVMEFKSTSAMGKAPLFIHRMIFRQQTLDLLSKEHYS